MNKQNYKWTDLSLGVCYYPEQWPRELWQDDLDRMKVIGINTIRIGEFAWSVFEPIEGRFVFDLFDDFMVLAKKSKMKVIMGTPTATPLPGSLRNIRKC